MLLKQKRRLGEEKRIFNSQWELDYFMIETPAHTMMCRICSQVVKTVEGDNANQHFCHHTLHAYAKLKAEPRKTRAEKLKCTTADILHVYFYQV